MERLLTLAGISAEWRGKVLADPLGAAAEAGIELADSERAILRAVPKPALEGMIASFARKHRGVNVARYATGAVAAAALLATGIAYGGDSPATKGGVRADDPGERPITDMPLGGIRPDVPEEAPPILWMTSLEDAMARANKESRAVMVVFLHPARGKLQVVAPDYQNVGGPEGPAVEKSAKTFLMEGKESRSAIRTAQVIAVRISPPAVPEELMATAKAEGLEVSGQDLADARKTVAAYLALLEKYGIKDKLPAVVFLAPDGSELAKAVQPDDEAVFVKLIAEVPPKLAKWINDQRRREPGQAVTDGIRPDEPVTKGIRPDEPKPLIVGETID